ncbi:DUF6491 family protein [Thermomonas sp.]|uniref:DUF6491 family protein n=1 Tax=Thermomonas sp. TaxID=1971895 RepID=UPI002487B7B5|nr:DUF6491 family protein [Thermomonas sp.]MDI1251972.1 DUF6491 family protein [Thermomonas sp.]
MIVASPTKEADMKSLIPLLAALSLAACATTAPSESARLALYQSHAGEPVKQIRYLNAMGWERVDGEHVVLNLLPRESWLLKLSGPCLDWGSGSPFLAFSSQTGWLISKFDSIKVSGSPVTCRIDEIRPIDMHAVHAAEKQMRDQPASGT